MPKGKTTSKECTICSKNVSLFAYNRHIKSHLNSKKSSIPFTQESCLHCSKIYFNKSGFSNHVRRCPKNPNRIIETLTDFGRSLIAKKNKEKVWTEERRNKHSEAMKKAVEKHPESYTSSNRGRTKQIIVDGIKLQGQWEVNFYLWAKNQGLAPIRPTVGFKYFWNGERTYYPDFYIKKLDLYIEIKGYETQRDQAKWSQFPNKLCIIKQKEITEIQKKIFRADSLTVKTPDS